MANLFKFIAFLCLILTLFIHGTQAAELTENRYMIFVKHSFQDRHDEKYKTFINGIIENIHDLIVSKKDTYQNPSFLEEMEKNFREDEDISPYVYQISFIEGSTVLFSYLTPELVKLVEEMDHVTGCEEDRKMSIDV